MTNQEQYWSKSLSVLDEKHFRIFIFNYHLVIKCPSLAFWGESHTTTHARDDIVYLELALADKCGKLQAA